MIHLRAWEILPKDEEQIIVKRTDGGYVLGHFSEYVPISSWQEHYVGWIPANELPVHLWGVLSVTPKNIGSQIADGTLEQFCIDLQRATIGGFIESQKADK